MCSLGLALLSATQGSLVLVYTCLFFIGVGRAFNNPASAALLPATVPPEVFGSAATWGSSAWQLAAVLGPALGGVLIAVFNRAMPVFMLDMVMATLFVILVAFIRGRNVPLSKEPLTLQSLWAGAKFIWNTKVILAAITLDMFGVLLGGATALMPVFAKDILHVDADGLGALRAAPSIGAVLMAVSLAHLPPFRQAGKTLLWAVTGFGVVTVIFGLSTSFPLSLMMLVLLGALDNISVVIRGTLLLTQTPDDMRGRISAVNYVFIGASNELGGFESGVAAGFLGPVLAVVGGGIGTILVVLGIAWFFPDMRQLKELVKRAVKDSPTATA
jgi:MFS family permease